MLSIDKDLMCTGGPFSLPSQTIVTNPRCDLGFTSATFNR